ncbi:Listeria/Bacterioides repeat-containing protein [Pseudobutyrivibrio sp. OR37]|uniref:leucine-rich repeat protein n=1 Tax=Pseudobutyrivibrio sp. OR37 TaxID=1798186 RepID=UPI0008EC87F0|nr:leucine-rich repeat protein [Pseudobutyrivibrio sp. OR37]SFH94556.1 Listeria/Bacterioides repeat-containing protein [Pseudobutyrivibrio sp. OR37]
MKKAIGLLAPRLLCLALIFCLSTPSVAYAMQAQPAYQAQLNQTDAAEINEGEGQKSDDKKGESSEEPSQSGEKEPSESTNENPAQAPGENKPGENNPGESQTGESKPDEEKTEENKESDTDENLTDPSEEEELLLEEPAEEEELLEDANHGKAGDNITWSYDESTYTLSFKGSGRMYDYSYGNNQQAGAPSDSNAPWYNYHKVMISANTSRDINIEFSDDITYIGSMSFVKFGIHSMKLPAKLTGIGKYAFSDASVTTGKNNPLVIPGTVKKVDDYSFYRASISYIEFKPGVKEIGKSAFSCAHFDDITWNDVSIIGENAFWYAGIHNFTVPAKCTLVKSGGFGNINGAKKVTFLGQLPTLEKDAFKLCYVNAFYNPNEKSFTKEAMDKASETFEGVTWIPNGQKVSNKAGDNITWSFDEKTETLIFSGYGDMYDYSPTKVYPWNDRLGSFKSVKMDDRITSIGEYAFYKAHVGKILVLPKKLKKIGKYAFYDAYLSDVQFPESVEVIDDMAFYSVAYMKNTNSFPKGVKRIGKKAFWDTDWSGEINLDSIERIEDEGLHFSQSIKHPIINNHFPNTLKYVGNRVFSNIDAKYKDTIYPDTIQHLGANCLAFSGGAEGTYTVPKGITSLSENFIFGSNYSKLIVGKQVKHLGASALYSGKLKEVVFEGDFPAYDGMVFKEVDYNNLLTIYYSAENETWQDGIADATYDDRYIQFVPVTNGKPVSVTFVGYDGKTVINKVQVTAGQSVAEPSAKLANLGGWYTEAKVQCELTKWDFTKPVNANMKLYAGKSYTGHRVYFKSNGGSPVSMQTVADGGLVKEPKEPTKNNARFDYWSPNKALNKEYYFKNKIKSDLILYAKWDRNHTKIIHHLDIGGFSSGTTSLYGTKSLADLYKDDIADLSKEYKATFKGWYYDKAFTKPVPGNLVFDSSKNETYEIYAKWEKTLVKVTFKYNDGVTKDKVVTVGYKEWIDSKDLKAPQRKGYQFAGWYDDEACTTSVAFVFESDAVKYAKWIPNKNGVSYYALLPHGYRKYLGYNSIETGNKLFKSDEEIINEVGDDYVVEGWYFDEACTKPISKSYLVDESVNAYVKLKLKTYTVTADPKNGEKPYTAELRLDDKLPFPIPKKEGYEFTYWLYQDSTDTTKWYYTDKLNRGLIKSGCKLIARYSQENIHNTSISISGIKDYTYTGFAITQPDLKVMDGKTVLTQGVDYTLAYSKNVNAGEAQVIINFKGMYSGKQVHTFMIKQADLAEAIKAKTLTTNEADLIYASNGRVQKATPKLILKTGEKAYTLKNTINYTLAYPKTDKKQPDYDANAFKIPGVYYITVNGKGNFKGTIKVKQEITTDKLVSKVTIAGLKAYTYTGNSICPDFTIKYGKDTVATSKDGAFKSDVLAVAYTDNKGVGTATIKLTGKAGSGYKGTKSFTFKITGTPISKAKVTGITSQIYDSEAKVQSGIILTVGKDELKNNKDYTVSYSNNINKGTAKILISGINGYTGSITKTFTIAAHDLSQDGTVTVDATAPYLKKGAKPGNITVKACGQTLVNNRDFTVTYLNNKKVGAEATVQITGKGNYKGLLKTTYKVVQGDFSKCKVVANNVNYKNKAGNFQTTVTVYDAEGTKLAAGVDYEKAFTYSASYNSAALDPKKDKCLSGTRYVTVKPKGNFFSEGVEVKASYRILPQNIKNISNAKFTIRDYTYTGKQIAPYIRNIVGKYGKTDLTPSIDFVVSEYGENTKLGTGYVIVKGQGAYTGTKKVTFKITKRAVK